jgi:hypothetical protein
MASAKSIDRTEVRLNRDDLQTLRRNDMLAVDHPSEDGVIVLTLATHNLSHQENGIVRDPVLTGKSIDRLKQGERLNYGARLSIALYADAVPSPEDNDHESVTR